MVRFTLALSLIANVAFAAALASYVDDYATLAAWACEHGNGGAARGEE